MNIMQTENHHAYDQHIISILSILRLMHNQSSFKVTWTPHDHRLVMWLTSDSLQTQASGHRMTMNIPGSSHDHSKVRGPLLPPNQSCHRINLPCSCNRTHVDLM